MGSTGILGILILFFTGIITYKGFKDAKYFDTYSFDIDGILMHKEYSRIITSGFLHTSWIHFGFNMITLLAFSDEIESMMGWWKYLLLYFGSMVGGSLLALYIHRNHGDYRAVGASGAISGMVASFIIFFPTANIEFLLIPIGIRSWILGLAFVIISILGIKRQGDNIGHEAHLGGIITGVLLTVLLQPSILWSRLWVVVLVLLPAMIFFYLVYNRPEMLLLEDYWGWDRRSRKFGLTKEEELNLLLDKIREEGITSLNRRERDRLKELRNDLL